MSRKKECFRAEDLEAMDDAIEGRYPKGPAHIAQTVSNSSTTEEWFLKRVEKSEDCWLWTGSRNSKGYGKFENKGRNWMAHRWSYEHYTGPIPSGLFVLHRCDVKNCVNPEHLFVGTHRANMADMTAKGRQARGERMGSAKLTDDLVREIGASSDPVEVLCDRYGVTEMAMRAVVNGESWKHVRPMGDEEPVDAVGGWIVDLLEAGAFGVTVDRLVQGLSRRQAEAIFSHMAALHAHPSKTEAPTKCECCHRPARYCGETHPYTPPVVEPPTDTSETAGESEAVAASEATCTLTEHWFALGDGKWDRRVVLDGQIIIEETVGGKPDLGYRLMSAGPVSSLPGEPNE